MSKEVRELARRSIESLPALSQRLSRSYADGITEDDFENIFSGQRFVHITVEAL